MRSEGAFHRVVNRFKNDRKNCRFSFRFTVFFVVFKTERSFFQKIENYHYLSLLPAHKGLLVKFNSFKLFMRNWHYTVEICEQNCVHCLVYILPCQVHKEQMAGNFELTNYPSAETSRECV